MIEACSLSSGSNGNSIVVKTGPDLFLIDAGISCKQICLRLQQVGYSLDAVKGIIITHEHSDHIRGLPVLLKKREIPVYLTSKTLERTNFPLSRECMYVIESGGRVSINGTTIQVLPKYHDASDPSLVCIYYKNKKISVVTDVGYICDNVIRSVRDADILFLEFNHDETMLFNGNYPFFLKKRIAGDRGHLSNASAANLILEHAAPRLQYLFLSHLSAQNNTPQRALDTLTARLKERDDLQNLKTIVASRYEVSPVVNIGT
jgi:phosphoribosyl 1,2-cyclic phosphodiesterase